MAILGGFTPYIAGTIAGLFILLAFRRRAPRSTLPLPPGPKPRPLVGNLFDLPREKEWLTYHAWAQQYGDLVYVEALGTKVLILGSAAVANELMDRRSAIYSSRPSAVMMNDLYVFFHSIE
jgi:hypothetical protein